MKRRRLKQAAGLVIFALASLLGQAQAHPGSLSDALRKNLNGALNAVEVDDLDARFWSTRTTRDPWTVLEPFWSNAESTITAHLRRHPVPGLDGHDLARDVLTRVAEKIRTGQLPRKPEAIRSWLSTTINNEVNRAITSQLNTTTRLGDKRASDTVRSKTVPLRAAASTSFDPTAVVNKSLDLQEKANRARSRKLFSLVDLSDQQRSVLRMRLDGMPFDEIAKTLNIDKGNAKMIWHRSAQRLRLADRVLNLPEMHRRVLLLRLRNFSDEAIYLELRSTFRHLNSIATVDSVVAEAEELIADDSIIATGHRRRSGAVRTRQDAGTPRSAATRSAASRLRQSTTSGVAARATGRATSRYPVGLVLAFLVALGAGALRSEAPEDD